MVPSIADPVEWARKLDYLRWSCDHLEGLYSREDERWRRTDEKTAQAVAAAAGSGGLALSALSPPLGRIAPMAFLGVAGVLLTVFFAYRTLSIREKPVLSTSTFVADDGSATSEDWHSRTQRYRSNLLMAIRRTRNRAEVKARLLHACQFCSLATILTMIGVILIHAVGR